ncbi:MAG: hypothetical protein J7L23_02250 [Candidatus Diapherotrites archaeon]|nr:hypothetical protein [Candidatus Diapherotrites archaeon]
MPEKPKILEAVSEMIAQGLSDEEIIENLRSVGLSDDQIKKIMEAANKDVYARFKRDMGKFLEERLKKNAPMIEKIVDDYLERKRDDIKKDLSRESQEIVGELAKEVNEKTRDMELTVKKIREENLQMRKSQQLNRSDIDLLLKGPFKLRMAISVTSLLIAIIVVGFDIFYMLPGVSSRLAASDLTGAAVEAIIATALIGFSISALAVCVYFSGRPGRG